MKEAVGSTCPGAGDTFTIYDRLGRVQYSGNTNAPTPTTPANTPDAGGKGASSASISLYEGFTSNQFGEISRSTGSGATPDSSRTPPSILGATRDSATRMALDDSGMPLFVIDTTSVTAGAMGHPTSSKEIASTGTSVSVLHADGQGNVALVTRLSSTGTGSGNHSMTGVKDGGQGTVLCSARFDPYGTPRSSATSKADPDTGETTSGGPCATGAPAANTRWWQGARRDTTTGDYRFGDRTYRPGLATWTSPDVWRNGTTANHTAQTADPNIANSYSYVNGDPVNLNDPSGHTAISCPDGECKRTSDHAHLVGQVDFAVDSLIAHAATEQSKKDNKNCRVFGECMSGQERLRNLLAADAQSTDPARYFISCKALGPGACTNRDLEAADVGDYIRTGGTKTHPFDLPRIVFPDHKDQTGKILLAGTLFDPALLAALSAKAATEVIDHVVLGLRKAGLNDTAERIGARTLMNVGSRDELMSLINQQIFKVEQGTGKLSLALDGLEGGPEVADIVKESLARHFGRAGRASGTTDAEISFLVENDALSAVGLYRAGELIGYGKDFGLAKAALRGIE